jgi:transcriptional regulator with XRE-family HTH domain
VLTSFDTLAAYQTSLRSPERHDVLGTAKVKLPEWALKISKLRESLGVSQTGLAEKLKVSPMSVSRWERGTQEPSAEILIMLGNLTAAPDNWYFWQAAGLSRRAIGDLRHQARVKKGALLPEFNDSSTKTARRTKGAKDPLIPIPLLRVSVGNSTSSSQHLSGEVEYLLAAPRSWCPHPTQTVCVHIDGDSMSPVLPKGSIAAVDTADTNAHDLHDKVVIAQHPASGLVIGKFCHEEPEDVLVPGNPTYDRIPFAAGWKVSGRVAWWIAFSS